MSGEFPSGKCAGSTRPGEVPRKRRGKAAEPISRAAGRKAIRADAIHRQWPRDLGRGRSLHRNGAARPRNVSNLVVENFRTRAGVILKRHPSARQIPKESGITAMAAVKIPVKTKWPSPSMMAAAAVAAFTVAEVFGGGNTTGFERFGDKFLD